MDAKQVKKLAHRLRVKYAQEYEPGIIYRTATMAIDEFEKELLDIMVTDS